MSIFLKTQRLLLRNVAPKDADTMFDYRNNDKPWGNSKDAPERAINKLMGATVGEEAEMPAHND